MADLSVDGYSTAIRPTLNLAIIIDHYYRICITWNDILQCKTSVAMPKVLVSGCFDLLHNGHIEFFREAAEHGDLYVRLGSAANIKSLKGRDTMYTDAERLYMVENIKCVKEAAISVGTGRFDFVQDAKELRFVACISGHGLSCSIRCLEIHAAPRVGKV